MADCVFSNRAVEDLSDIWHYTLETWSELQADTYYNMLVDACRMLAARPSVGRKYEEIAPGLLGFKSGMHLIFYRKTSSTGIEVIRILHERMDLKSRMQD